MTVCLLSRLDAAASGVENMAADRELLRSVESNAAGDRAEMRIYGWAPPTISLGFHQDADELDAAAMARDGVSWVRRPTGGAAIFHDEEITFALAAPLPVPASRDIASLYAWVSGSIVAALGRIGVPARCAGSGRALGGACFASVGGHEIVVGERKICGSALRRGRGAYLIHGSLLTGASQARIACYLRRGPSEAELLERSTDLRREGVSASESARLWRYLREEFELGLARHSSEAGSRQGGQVVASA